MRFHQQLSAAATLLATSAGALAHEGHGLPGIAHWHATDVLGFTLVALLAGIAIWLSRGD
jgi:hypothetical protein